MKISNMRRGRSACFASFVPVLVIFIYALHKWTSRDEKTEFLDDYYADSDEIIIKKSQRNVYPELRMDPGNFEPEVVMDSQGPLPPATGPGEGGRPLLPHWLEEWANDVADSEREYGLNLIASSYIAMNRSIPDTRLEECEFWHYPEDLPKTSVIIVFHNEGLSVLMRTIHSVINRSPPSLLHEVMLLDDHSDKKDLKDDLENYIKITWYGKVRLIRNGQREGRIRTKCIGAQEATGEVIIFLDAHCEVNVNWLPPLLAPIYRDHQVLTVPIIDMIDHNTFEYKPVYKHGTNHRGIFEWGMLYKETEIPKIKEASLHKQRSEPYKSPTHAGGLFAINRQYFLELGAYDSGLLVWGGENFDLSFKIWQCGGSIEWVPCSRVGHVFRAFLPHKFGRLEENGKGPLKMINYKRIIEIWFDEEHKEYFYTREPMARFLDMGDITDQVALKNRLKCKSFKWFMENVAYDVYDNYPKPPKNVHWGMTKNKGSGTCLDTLGRAAPNIRSAYIGTSSCYGEGQNQLFRLNERGQLGVGDRCVEADSDSVKQEICLLGTVDGPWRYDETHSHLIHRLNGGHCLTLHPATKRLGLAPCVHNNTFQQWIIYTIYK